MITELDKTFALRLLNFIKDVKVYDCASEEEQEYLTLVAEKLLRQQVNEAIKNDDKEILEYLKNCGII